MIRKATESDIAAVAEIYAHILKNEDAAKPATGWLKGVYPVEATARAALGRDDLFVCVEDGRIAASAIINKTQVDVYADCKWSLDCADDEVMVLHTLTVDPDLSGRGIGRAFAQFYEDCARQAGCTVLRIDTNERNIAARHLYASLGYREADIVPCDFNRIPKIHLVLLEKKL